MTSSQHKFLGINADGMLVALHRAVEMSLLPGPVLMIRDGEFNLNGDRRTVLARLQSDEREFHNEMSLSPLGDTIKPWDQFPDH